MAGSIDFNANITATTKKEIVYAIKRSLKEVKLYKQGKIKLNTLENFLAQV